MSYNPFEKNGFVYREYEVIKAVYLKIYSDYCGAMFFKEKDGRFFIKTIPPYYYVFEKLSKMVPENSIILQRELQ